MKIGKVRPLISVFWILQGLLCIFAVSGMGNLTTVCGIMLIVASVLSSTSNEIATLIGNMLLILYAVAVVIMLAIATIMLDFNAIPKSLYILAIFNFYCIYTSFYHKE